MPKISDENLMWTETGKEELYRTPILTLTGRKSISPEGREGKYIVIDAPDWVITIPVIKEDGSEKFLIVKQWRHGIKAVSMEFPGGVIDGGEKPEDAARRELKEETGCEAGALIPLGSFSPNPAIMSNRVYCFAAENLVQASEQQLDADEYVSCCKIDQEEVFAKTGMPQYPHALMAAALELYRQYISDRKKQGGPSAAAASRARTRP